MTQNNTNPTPNDNNNRTLRRSSPQTAPMPYRIHLPSRPALSSHPTGSTSHVSSPTKQRSITNKTTTASPSRVSRRMEFAEPIGKMDNISQGVFGKRMKRPTSSPNGSAASKWVVVVVVYFSFISLNRERVVRFLIKFDLYFVFSVHLDFLCVISPKISDQQWTLCK